jgi:hypothetical protein
METITTFEGFIWTIADLTVAVKALCVKFAVLFGMLTACYGVIKFYMGFEDEGKLNLKKYVFSPLILVFILANYSTMIDITGKVGGIMINNSPGNDITASEMLLTMEKNTTSSAMDRVKEAYMETQVDEPGFFEKSYTYLTSAAKSVAAVFSFPARAIWSFLQFGFMKIMRIVIMEVRNVVLGFLIIVGPLAILFSILPLFRDNFKKWFRMYVAVMLWALSINLIDAMVVGYYENANEFELAYIYKNDDGSQYTDINKLDNETVIGIHSINGIEYGGMENGFINFTFAMMYLMVPLLTAFFIGDKLAGGFLSFMVAKTVGTAMDVVKTAAGGMGGGGGAAAAGGSGGGTISGMK